MLPQYPLTVPDISVIEALAVLKSQEYNNYHLDNLRKELFRKQHANHQEQASKFFKLSLSWHVDEENAYLYGYKSHESREHLLDWLKEMNLVLPEKMQKSAHARSDGTSYTICSYKVPTKFLGFDVEIEASYTREGLPTATKCRVVPRVSYEVVCDLDYKESNDE